MRAIEPAVSPTHIGFCPGWGGGPGGGDGPGRPPEPGGPGGPAGGRCEPV